jgi:hypothetical protein
MVPHTHDTRTVTLREVLDLQAGADVVRTQSGIRSEQTHALRQQRRDGLTDIPPHTLPLNRSQVKESHEPHP